MFYIAGHGDVAPIQHGLSMSFLATQHEEMIDRTYEIDWFIDSSPFFQKVYDVWHHCCPQEAEGEERPRAGREHKNGWITRWSYFGPSDTDLRYCYILLYVYVFSLKREIKQNK